MKMKCFNRFYCLWFEMGKTRLNQQEKGQDKREGEGNFNWELEFGVKLGLYFLCSFQNCLIDIIQKVEFIKKII